MLRSRVPIAFTLTILFAGCKTNAPELRTETFFYKSLMDNKTVSFQTRTYSFSGDTIWERIVHLDVHKKDTLGDIREFRFRIHKDSLFWKWGNNPEFLFLSNSPECNFVENSPAFALKICPKTNLGDSVLMYTKKELEIDGISKRLIRLTNLVLLEETIEGDAMNFDRVVQISEEQFRDTQKDSNAWQ